MGTYSNSWSNAIAGTTATAQDIGHRRVVRAVRPMDIDDEKDDKRVYRKRDLEPPVLTLADAANHNTNQFQANKRVRQSSNSAVAVPRFTDYGFTDSQVSHHNVRNTSAPTTRTFRRATRPTSAPVSKPSIPSAAPMAPPQHPFPSPAHNTNPFTGYNAPMTHSAPSPPFVTAPHVKEFSACRASPAMASTAPTSVRSTQVANPFTAYRPTMATQPPTPPFTAVPSDKPCPPYAPFPPMATNAPTSFGAVPVTKPVAPPTFQQVHNPTPATVKIPPTTTRSNTTTHTAKSTRPSCPPLVQAKIDSRNKVSLTIDKYQQKIDKLNEMIVLESMGQGNHTKVASSKRQKASSSPTSSAVPSVSVVQRGMMMKRDKLAKNMQLYQQEMTNLTMEINKELYGNYFHSA